MGMGEKQIGILWSYLRGLRLDLAVVVVSNCGQFGSWEFGVKNLPSTGERAVNLAHLVRCVITCRLMKSCRLDERCDVKVVVGDRGWRNDWE